jgi:hypothetical protein
MPNDKASVCNHAQINGKVLREGEKRGAERNGRLSMSSACPDARAQSAPLVSMKKTFEDRERRTQENIRILT